MEEYNQDAWHEIVERCQDAGVDAFELNMSCPHGLPERKMGAAMGENPDILEEVCGWVMEVAKLPVWAKMTPNVTHIEDPTRASLRAGCDGISAINTIRSVMGVDLETLRPEPTVEGYTTPGGYSCQAVMPIALRMCMEIAKVISEEFPGRTLSGIGGIETGNDAAQFILLGCDTVQVCTGVMKFGYPIIRGMQEQLLAFMEKHKFERLEDFKGHSVQYLHDARRPGEASSRGPRRQEGRARSQEDDPRRRGMGRRRFRQTKRGAGPWIVANIQKRGADSLSAGIHDEFSSAMPRISRSQGSNLRSKHGPRRVRGHSTDRREPQSLGRRPPSQATHFNKSGDKL